jgi:hypothetical protein
MSISNSTYAITIISYGGTSAIGRATSATPPPFIERGTDLRDLISAVSSVRRNLTASYFARSSSY